MSKLFEIKIDKRAFDRAERLLKDIPKNVSKVLRRSINEAVRFGNTEMARKIREIYTVKKKKVSSVVKLRLARGGDLEGQISVQDRSVAAMHFNVKPGGDTTGKRRKPIRLTVKNGSTETLDKASRVGKFSGNIFQRVGKGRGYERVTRLSVVQMANNKGISEAVQKKMKEQFEARLDHQVQQVLKGKS